MPPRLRSRHTYTIGFEDADTLGKLQLSEREPFYYRDYPDNREHVVVQGDTLHRLAGAYFAPIDDPAQLWWVIADFQPAPIHDPTIRLEPGSTIIIPSVRTVLEVIFSENRRLETGV